MIFSKNVIKEYQCFITFLKIAGTDVLTLKGWLPLAQFYGQLKAGKEEYIRAQAKISAFIIP